MPEYLDKQVAKIKASLKSQGHSDEEATRIAWATINKRKKRKKVRKARS